MKTQLKANLQIFLKRKFFYLVFFSHLAYIWCKVEFLIFDNFFFSIIRHHWDLTRYLLANIRLMQLGIAVNLRICYRSWEEFFKVSTEIQAPCCNSRGTQTTRTPRCVGPEPGPVQGDKIVKTQVSPFLGEFQPG